MEKIKLKHFLKNNIKFALGFIIGTVLASTSVYAATYLFTSNEVSYDNSSSGLTSDNVKGALDELYTKASASANKIVYTHSTEIVSLYKPMPAGIEQTNDIDNYYKFSIRHNLINNIVMESDLEFELSSKRYVLKGGDLESNYENNKIIAADAFGEDKCHAGTNYYYCYSSSSSLSLTSQEIRYEDAGGCEGCKITSNGESSCYYIGMCSSTT